MLGTLWGHGMVQIQRKWGRSVAGAGQDWVDYGAEE
jgi:hypothetical protein